MLRVTRNTIRPSQRVGQVSGLRAQSLAQQLNLGRELNERFYPRSGNDLGQGSGSQRLAIAHTATERRVECGARRRTEDSVWLSESARCSRAGMGKQIDQS